MSLRTDLENAAREFATQLRTLLNGTVCDGDALIYAIPMSDTRCSVGTRIGRQNLNPRPIRLRTRNPGAYCWLRVACRVYKDDRDYLTVLTSVFEVSTGEEGEHVLFHYDYERDKDSYTEAHVQVAGDNPHLDDLMAAVGKHGRTLRHLHLPVGGRRFRPSLEDVLEFLAHERIVDPIDGWQEVLNSSRDRFRTIQLKAAIAKNPELAVAALRECGYSPATPEPQGAKRRRWRKDKR